MEVYSFGEIVNLKNCDDTIGIFVEIYFWDTKNYKQT